MDSSQGYFRINLDEDDDKLKWWHFCPNDITTKWMRLSGFVRNDEEREGLKINLKWWFMPLLCFLCLSNFKNIYHSQVILRPNECASAVLSEMTFL